MSAAMALSEPTKARFAREVAKFPADQKQSAVMACLAIVQQEQGYVSAEAEEAVAAYLGMPPIAVRDAVKAGDIPAILEQTNRRIRHRHWCCRSAPTAPST